MDENDSEFDSFIVPSSSNRKRKSFLPDRTGATDDTDFGLLTNQNVAFSKIILEEVDHEENSKSAKKRRSVLLAKISANKSRNRTVNESDAQGKV